MRLAYPGRAHLAGLVAGLVVVALLAVPAFAASIKVDCGADPSALQPAIDAAKPGKLLVISGTCSGDFTIAKDLRLTGASGTDATLSGSCYVNTTLTIVSGTVLLKDMTVRCGDNAGIHNAGTLTLQKVTVFDNSVGVDNAGTLTLIRSTLSGNGADGGAIRNEGLASILSSTVDHNSNGIGDAGGINNFGTMTIDASTVSYNSGDASEGGILNLGSLVITRSTVIGNHADDGFGAGIENRGGTLDVISSTITGNEADEGGAGISSLGSGSSTTITGSILAGNFYGGSPSEDDCWGTVSSGGYNLIGNVDPVYDAHCDLVQQSTDLIGHLNGAGVIDPKLGVFGNHGGPSATVPLLSLSPALNAIPIGALAVDGTSLCPSSGSTDQRGHPRPRGGACDIGSYEK